jgi:excisionase family DNA binding protein
MSAQTADRPTTTRRESATGRPLLTMPEAARALGLNLKTVEKAVKGGDLPAVKLGARRWVRAADIDKLLTPVKSA